MTYSVVWSVDAAQIIIQLELVSNDRQRVRQAAAYMERMLRRYPRDMGESRDPGFRLRYEDVLGIYYRIDEDNLRVEIIYAGPARRR